MTAERPTWRDRYPDEVTCVRCLELRDVAELDRLLWCDRCRGIARNRAGWWGWLGGLALGMGVALYIWQVIRPRVLIGAWFGTVAAAIWIGQKVSRELAYGVMRLRNARAVEAVPPELPEDGAEE